MLGILKMELSSEDNLRLNVLLAQELQAIRIDESKMIVYGLSANGEAKVALHPTGRSMLYLKKVRELISTRFLNSPGGYPVFLRRWSQMGQARNESLEPLLKLGVEEAVEAVVSSPGITPELARRAWWAMPYSTTARSLLKQPQIAQSDIGQVLAQHLVEDLPFESETENVIESVQLVLQPGLISEAVQTQLWQKGRAKNAYYLGFLIRIPDALPPLQPARVEMADIQTKLQDLSDNPFANQLCRVMSDKGQTYLAVVEKILQKPADQQVVNLLFDTIAAYFSDIYLEGLYDDEMDMAELIKRAENLCQAPSRSNALETVISRVPHLQSHFIAMLVLAGLRYSVLRPIFGKTTAIGSLMRKKLTPVTSPLLQHISVLQGRHL